jgi:quinol monooxygenase YgiN
MILVDARCTILPERCEAFIREVKTIVPTVCREAGCSRYELLSDGSTPGVFHFLEQWESQRHLDDHIAQPHMKEYFAKTGSWQAAPTLLTIYEVRSMQSITMGE